VIDPNHESEYKEAQKRVRQAHDQARHIIEQIEHADNSNQAYPFSSNDEHAIRQYMEALHHLSDVARRYFGN
jgi:vacuolar-type H+-ATPase subunit H